MRLRRALVPLLLVAISPLAACGGDDGDDDTAGGEPSSEVTAEEDDTAGDEPSSEVTAEEDETDAPSGPCELLSTDEVAAAVGSPVKEGTALSGPAVTGGTFDTCAWQSDDPTSPADTATVTIYPNAAAADSARTDDSEDVAGIGDKAFTIAFAGIWFYEGERSYFVQWYAFSHTDEENLPKSEALAKAFVEAL